MIQANSKVTHNGRSYQNGDIIEDIDQEAATRLVNLGVAFFLSVILKETEDDPENTGIPETSDYAELDQAYNYEELKTLAKELGIEFPGNISKTKLIDKIIEEDKVELFFE